jgi:uncharacterized protein
VLSREFGDIFSDIFGQRSNNFKKIVTALSQGPLSNTQIAELTKLPKTGRLSEYMQELTLSGFVSKAMSWEIKTKKSLVRNFKYRLKDNYLRFYLKYIEPKLNEINSGQLAQQSISSLPNWPAIAGLQFENLVINNAHLVLEALNLNKNDIVKYGSYFQNKTKKHNACQIDCLTQTKFNTLFLCEIKFSSNEITSKIINEVEQKIQKIDKPKGYSVFPVLIHANSVHPSIVEADYFSRIIDVSDVFDQERAQLG